MAEQPLHIAVLEHLARRITDRRDQIKEHMAAGLPATEYERHVGRARECKSLIEDIEETLARLKAGDLDEEEHETDDRIEERITRRKPRGARAR